MLELTKAFQGGVSFWKIFWQYQGIALGIYVVIVMLSFSTDSPSQNPAWLKMAEAIAMALMVVLLLVMVTIPYLLWVNASGLESERALLFARIYTIVIGAWLYYTAYLLAADLFSTQAQRDARFQQKYSGEFERHEAEIKRQQQEESRKE